MSRRYSDLDDLLNHLDAEDSLSDDPFGIAEFDDDDLSILGQFSPDSPRVKKAPKPAARKRGRPRKTPE